MRKFEKNLKKIIEDSRTILFYQEKDAIESGITKEQLSYLLDQDLIEYYRFHEKADIDLIRPTHYGLSYFYGRRLSRIDKAKQIVLNIGISAVTAFICSLLSDNFWNFIKFLIENSQK